MSKFPLWRETPRAERELNSKYFISLTPNLITGLDLESSVKLIQWMLSRDHIEATEIKETGNGIEMRLQNTRRQQKEYLRFYLTPPPVNVIYDILETLKGQDYQKARLYSVTCLSQSQHEISNQYPLFFEVVDGEKYINRLQDVQRRLTQPPAWQVEKNKKNPSKVDKPFTLKRSNPAPVRKNSALFWVAIVLASLAILSLIAVASYILSTS